MGCAGYVVGCIGYVVGGLCRLCGGLHPNNQATSWPNLHAQDKQDFNSSWNCKLGPSVAIWENGRGSICRIYKLHFSVPFDCLKHSVTYIILCKELLVVKAISFYNFNFYPFISLLFPFICTASETIWFSLNLSLKKSGKIYLAIHMKKRKKLTV